LHLLDSDNIVIRFNQLQSALNNYPVIFQNVSYHYDSTVVLDNLSFEVEPNLITVIIGKSGSGKSS